MLTVSVMQYQSYQSNQEDQIVNINESVQCHVTGSQNLDQAVKQGKAVVK